MIEQTIRKILTDYGRIPVDLAGLTDHDDLFQVGLTSHATVNVLLALEETFDIEFPEEMMRKRTFESVAAIKAAIDQLGGSPLSG
ncbi:MAG: acyl carrier protein [Acidimicrobiales bacterium]